MKKVEIKTGSLAHLYLRVMYYQVIGIGQLDKPLRLRNEVGQVLILLGVSGVSIWHWRVLLITGVAFLLIEAVFVILGYLSVKRGWVDAEVAITNDQNPQVVEIL